LGGNRGAAGAGDHPAGAKHRRAAVGADEETDLEAAVVETGRRVAKWCFVPEGDLVAGDILLAQKIALETMESKVLELGNTQTFC
jgi:hypothetical protein